MTKLLAPFADYRHHFIWKKHNCFHCKTYYNSCDLDTVLEHTVFTQQLLPLEVAERIGISKYGLLVKNCKEFIKK